MNNMIFTTTATLQGKIITQYLGVVTGHAVIGINAMKDAFASVRDFTGGRVASYEKEVAKARDYASDMMAEYARQAGANAVIGIDLDFEILGKENGMIMVVASGTAVRYEQEQKEQAGADGVIGIDLDIEITGKENGMFKGVARGTATRREKGQQERNLRYGN